MSDPLFEFDQALVTCGRSAAQKHGPRPLHRGQGNLMDIGKVRSDYIAALRAADGHEVGPLMAFVRS